MGRVKDGVGVEGFSEGARAAAFADIKDVVPVFLLSCTSDVRLFDDNRTRKANVHVSLRAVQASAERRTSS